MRSLVAVVLVAALLSPGCTGSSPSATVETFFKAMENGDAAAMRDTLSKSSASLLDDAKVKAGAPSRRLIEEKIDGEKATVTLELSDSRKGSSSGKNEPFEIAIVLVREDKVWKIDVKLTIEEAVARKAGQAIVWLAGAAQGFQRAIEAEGRRLVQAFEQLGASLGKALTDIGRGFQRGLQSAGEGLKKGMEEKGSQP